MSLFQRLGQVVRSQMTALSRSLDDPEALLIQMTEQMELELIELRRALAEAIATNKSTERQLANEHLWARKWYERAQLAVDQNQEKVARDSLGHHHSHLNHIQSLELALKEQIQVIQQVKINLQTLERKYSQIKSQKSLYLARLKSAIAAQKMQEIMDNWDHRSASSLFERLETRILELEAQSELARPQADPLENQFLNLESSQKVENSLKNLQSQRRPLPPN
ncbi:MAG: PspA/IM30 family protein [Microcystaceae cyanobacterium]